MRPALVLRTIAFPLLLLGATGCGGDGATGPTSSDLLRASAAAGTITLTNRTSGQVDYILATQHFLEVADPGPCTRPEGCTTSVPARSTVRVPYSAVLGYSPGERTAIVVHWSHAPAPSTSFNVRRIVLRLL